jgi:uncharacterized Zn finger protein
MGTLRKKKTPAKKMVSALTAKARTIADKISEDWLRKNSRPKAFARATAYAHDDIIEILHWSDQEIIAEMYGSQPYTISLRHNRGSIHADCTCPARHDWPGFCKHIVGLGLYVIACREQAAGFPRLKDAIGSALQKLPSQKLYALCIDLAFLNRNFRDRILNELGIIFESKHDWGEHY